MFPWAKAFCISRIRSPSDDGSRSAGGSRWIEGHPDACASARARLIRSSRIASNGRASAPRRVLMSWVTSLGPEGPACDSTNAKLAIERGTTSRTGSVGMPIRRRYVQCRLGQFAIPLAKVLAQRPAPRRRIDQFHLTASIARLAVAQHPDIGGHAGVVEHVQ